MKLDYESGSVVISAVGTYAKSRKAVANEAVVAAREFVKFGKACEKHLADQLLVPLEMFVGYDYDCESERRDPQWTLAVQKETKHYTTNSDVIAQFTVPW